MKHINKPNFEYLVCERKNGKKFIKILEYINDADGYVEVARINQIKSNWIENGWNDVVAIQQELEHNRAVTGMVFRKGVKQ